MSDDLVKRLREQATRPHLEYSAKLMREAADVIERLLPFAPRVINLDQTIHVDSSGNLSFSPPSADAGTDK